MSFKHFINFEDKSKKIPESTIKDLKQIHLLSIILRNGLN
jgi:hypothetical protein